MGEVLYLLLLCMCCVFNYSCLCHNYMVVVVAGDKIKPHKKLLCREQEKENKWTAAAGRGQMQQQAEGIAG